MIDILLNNFDFIFILIGLFVNKISLFVSFDKMIINQWFRLNIIALLGFQKEFCDIFLNLNCLSLPKMS